MALVEYNGTIHEFPDDWTDDQIAEALSTYKAEEPAPAPVEAPPAQQEAPPPATGGRLAGALQSHVEDRLGGLKVAGDAALTMAAGAVTEVGAGWAGILALANGEGLDKAAQAVENVRSLAYAPKTKEVNEALQFIAPAMQEIDETVTDVSEIIGFGNPAASAAAKTAILGLPEILGTKGTRLTGFAKRSTERGALKATTAARAASLGKAADELGIKLDSDSIHATVQAAGRKLSTAAERGENLDKTVAALRGKRAKAKAAVDRAYDRARAYNVAIQSRGVVDLADNAEATLLSAGYDLASESMAPVRNALTSMRKFSEEIPSIPAGRQNPNVGYLYQNLNELDVIRKRLGKVRSPDGAVNSAVREIRSQIDAHIDAEFNRGAIAGNPAAHAAWRKARGAHASYMKRFNENKVIRQLALENATTETAAQWLLGASSMAGPKNAGLVAARMKRMLGADSPGFDAIRQTVLFDALSPITTKMAPSPGDFSAVANNLHKLSTKNATLIKELGLPAEQLSALRHAALTAANTRAPAAFMRAELLTQSIVRFTAGHGIAKAGMRVRILQGLLDAATGVKKKSHKELLREYAGVDMDAPLVQAAKPAELGEVLLLGYMAQMTQGEAQGMEDDGR